MLPQYLAVGVDYHTFWESNPHDLQPFVKAFELKRIAQDSRDWYMGRYVESALASVLGHLFSKNSNAQYVKKPFFDDYAKEKEGNKDSQNNEIVAALEMDQYIKVLMQQGNLPETVIADIKES